MPYWVPFHLLVRFVGLRWRHSNPPPRAIQSQRSLQNVIKLIRITSWDDESRFNPLVSVLVAYVNKRASLNLAGAIDGVAWRGVSL
jgi:hypothetical protein